MSYTYPLITSMLIKRFESSYLGKMNCTTSWLCGRFVPTEDGLFLFLNKIIFLDDIIRCLKNTHTHTHTHTSHIIYVSEIFMLNAIYHYYAVSGEINPLYLLQLILLLLLRFYLVSIEKQKSTSFLN